MRNRIIKPVRMDNTLYLILQLMTVSAFATAVVATAITAAVASATATPFATHHFHQFLNFRAEIDDIQASLKKQG